MNTRHEVCADERKMERGREAEGGRERERKGESEREGGGETGRGLQSPPPTD